MIVFHFHGSKHSWFSCMLQLGQWFCVGYMNREKEQEGLEARGGVLRGG